MCNITQNNKNIRRYNTNTDRCATYVQTTDFMCNIKNKTNVGTAQKKTDRYATYVQPACAANTGTQKQT